MRSAQNCRKCTFLDNLRTVTQDVSMETLDKGRHFSSTFYDLLFQNQSPIFCCPLFSENYLNPQARINKMVNKHAAGYHPSPSQLISRIYTLVFLWIPKGFISPESFLNFFINLYIPPWLRKSFKFIVLRPLQIHL